MGIPQILMVMWCMFAFVFGLCKIGNADAYGGVTVLAVVLHTIGCVLFQGLLFWGGFYG